MTGPGRAQLLIAVLVTLASALSVVAPAGADAPGRFHRLGSVPSGGQLWSDGVRFAAVTDKAGGPPLVFDTLRRRHFRLTAPVPGCLFGGSGIGLVGGPGPLGGGLALWHCPPPRETLISSLASGRSREPAGIERFDGEFSRCAPYGIGRHWLKADCGGGIGPHEPGYLNHRTGVFVPQPVDLYFGHPRIDLDYAGLIHDACAPLGPWLDGAPSSAVYKPPFLLDYAGPPSLRRCGQKRTELLTPGCGARPCDTPQLGSRYITWGEPGRVFAYLPRIRRRVLVGRAPAELRGHGGRLLVAHTCTRVFAQWSRNLFVARFNPREGAPPCQAAG